MKYLLLNSIFLVFLSINTSFAQDDSEGEVNSAITHLKEELEKEQKALNFEKFFMEAIQQKSIENYDKALVSLAECQQIFPKNVAMLFELAKNHFALKQYIEAHHYCDMALQKEPTNFWVLELSREIFIKEQNYSEAVKVQKKLYAQKPSEAETLLRLYYYKKDITSGKQLLLDIDKKNIYVTTYSFYNTFFNKDLVPTAKSKEIPKKDRTISELQKDFAKNTNFGVLKNLLEREFEESQFQNLLKDSSIGLSLYPAQSIVYLYNGLALQALNKPNEAILMLEEGVGFVFDDPSLSKRFYTALVDSYNLVKNAAKANKYKQLVQKL